MEREQKKGGRSLRLSRQKVGRSLRLSRQKVGRSLRLSRCRIQCGTSWLGRDASPHPSDWLGRDASPHPSDRLGRDASPHLVGSPGRAGPVPSRAGFTLVEVVLATVISVMVFAAMGVLLTRCFSLWLEATARWQMAQTARITRERILSGGFGDPSDGLLAAENTTDFGSGMESGWNYLFYRTVEKPAVWQILRGWQGTADQQHIQLRRGLSGWVYAQSSLNDEPRVTIDRFVFTEGDPIELRYRLRMRVVGREIEQEHAIRAKLVNRK